MNSLLLAELKFSGYKYHNKHMNNNLKEMLSLMLFLTDEQPLSEDIEKINFKKHGWWKKYHWKEKMEERFIELMADKLKTNWQDIVDTKPTTYKKRIKIAEEFVFNYSPITRPLNIEDFTPLVPWGQLEDVMSKNQLERFQEWMFGQTSSIHGVYKWDLERWLNSNK